MTARSPQQLASRAETSAQLRRIQLLVLRISSTGLTASAAFAVGDQTTSHVTRQHAHLLAARPRRLGRKQR